MVITLVTNRRFFRYVNQWRVGVDAATHSYLTAGSGFLNVEWEENDPYVKLPIPGGVNAVYQLIGNPDVTGLIRCRDYEGIYQLLYSTNINVGADKAVTTTTRNVIDYFVVQVYAQQVVAATGVTTQVLTLYTFTNTRIGRIFKAQREPASPWTVEFYADYVTPT